MVTFTEDGGILSELLRRGQYTAAVGNPPYITVDDRVLRDRYRRNYPVCTGLFHLSVPFVERFFQLVRVRDSSGRAGFIGQITDNSFMKRNFGKRLIEKYLPTVELTHVIDATGVNIPGHGTPTVILAGRRRVAATQKVRVVQGINGEPQSDADAVAGPAWRTIVENIARPGFVDQYVSVVDASRAVFSQHPWSLAGGVADDLWARIDAAAASKLEQHIASVGYTGQTNADDIFLARQREFSRSGLQGSDIRSFVTGDDVQDYSVRPKKSAIFPYSETGELWLEVTPMATRWLWPARQILYGRTTFSGGTYQEDGRTWWEWHQVARSRLKGRALTWVFMDTGNQFAYLAECAIHNRHAPMIKLHEAATEAEYHSLLGLLGSSTACFWLKQVSQNRGEGGGSRVEAGYSAMGSESWKNRYEFPSTKLKAFPLPEVMPTILGTTMDGLAKELSGLLTAVMNNKESLTPGKWLFGIKRG